MPTSPNIKRFFRYTGVGVSTFGLDLVMLYTATSVFGISYLLATPVSFLIAVSINYAVSRRVAFAETKRPWRSGYAYFITAAAVGALATTGIVAAFVSYLGLFYLTARIITSFIVGMGNYLFNFYVNFKVARVHYKLDSLKRK